MITFLIIYTLQTVKHHIINLNIKKLSYYTKIMIKNI